MTSLKTFFDIEKAIQFLSEINEEELSEEEKEEIEIMLEELSSRSEEKIDNFVRVRNTLLGIVSACKEESKRLNQRAASIQKAIDRMDNRRISNMTSLGIIKAKGKIYEVSLRNSERTIIDNEDELTIEFVTIKEEKVPNKKLIKDTLKCGHVVPGAHIEKVTRLHVK